MRWIIRKSVWRPILLLLLFLFSAVVIVQAEWTHRLSDETRDLSIPVSSAIDINSERWLRDVYRPYTLVERGDYFYGSGRPCPGGGVCHTYFTKHDKACGNIVWGSNPGNALYNVVSHSYDVVALGNRVYSVLGGQYPSIYYLVEMDESNGNLIANYELDNIVNYAGVYRLVTDGTRVYAFTSSGSGRVRVKAFNHNTKTFDWTIDFNIDDVNKGEVNSQPAIFQNQLVFVVDHHEGGVNTHHGPATLYSFNKDTGAPLWSQVLHNSAENAATVQIVVHNNKIFLDRRRSGYWDKLSSYNPLNNGALLWGPFDDLGTNLAAYNNLLYARIPGAQGVRALNANTGSVIWTNSGTDCDWGLVYLAGPNELICMHRHTATSVYLIRVDASDGDAIDTTGLIQYSSSTFVSNELFVFSPADPFLLFHYQNGLGSVGGSTPDITSISVSPPSATVPVFGTRQFTATCVTECGDTIECPALTWTSTIGSVDNTGLFTAGATTGVGVVRASYGGVFDEADITVVGLPVCSVCTVNGNCASGYCRETFEGGVKRCAPDATSCVIDQNNNCDYPDGYEMCFGNDYYRECGASGSGLWGAPNNCDDSVDYEGCDPGSENEDSHPGASCGWRARPGETCTSGMAGGCFPGSWGSCQNCGSFISQPSHDACYTTGLPFCDEGCGAECDEDSDCTNTERCYAANDIYQTRDASCSNSCACSYAPWENGACSESVAQCGAECDGDEDCDIYDDRCVGRYWRDYETSQGTCNTDPSECACTPPDYDQYCWVGHCGANCDENSDCTAYPDGTCSACGCRYPPDALAVVNSPGFQGLPVPIQGDGWAYGATVSQLTWSKQSGPGGSDCVFDAPALNLGSSHATAHGTVTCDQVGDYVLRLLVRDSNSQTDTDSAALSLTDPVGVWGTVQIVPPANTVYADNLIRSQTFEALCFDNDGNGMACPADPVWSLSGFGAGTTASISPQANPVFADFSHQSIDVSTASGTIRADVLGVVGSMFVPASNYLISVQPSSVALSYGGTQLFTASCIDGGVPFMCPGSISWSLENGLEGSLTPSGFYTAPFTDSVGNVRATIGILYGEALVSVQENAPAPQEFDLLTLNCPRLSYTDSSEVTVQCLRGGKACQESDVQLSGAPIVSTQVIGNAFIYQIESVQSGSIHLRVSTDFRTTSCTITRAGIERGSIPEMHVLFVVLVLFSAFSLMRRR
ncbi:PQQ-binding-like beta-propeller repeat protein [Candidatus Micrarchaeota archaeon]|nr:PQQ-binding-like beta-propeller repeat protein [Candidatus Micrarchaeota archaeon]